MVYTVHGILQARILEWVAFPFFRGSSQPRDWTLPLQVESLPAEPQGKAKNTGMGTLSVLQQIFLTQEFNWDLLHCRRILYPLSSQPIKTVYNGILYSQSKQFSFTLIHMWRYSQNINKLKKQIIKEYLGMMEFYEVLMYVFLDVFRNL